MLSKSQCLPFSPTKEHLINNKDHFGWTHLSRGKTGIRNAFPSVRHLTLAAFDPSSTKQSTDSNVLCEIRILQSDISFKNLSVKGFYKRSKHFPSVDRFNNSQNFFSYLIRKLMCTLYMKKIRTLKSVADNFYKSKSLQSTKIGRESSKLVWHGPG